MLKYLISIIFVSASLFAQSYHAEFINGVKTETFTYEQKIYIGDPFWDTSVCCMCEILDSMPNGNVDLTFTAVGDDGNIGQPAAYKLYYGDVNLGNSINIQPMVMAGETESLSVVLQAGKKYYFQMEAIDEAGNKSAPGNIVSATPNGYLYKQIPYVLDTAYVILKTYPNKQYIPSGVFAINGLGFESGRTNNGRNIITIHMNEVRRQDNSMDNRVDLSDLSALILYLTAGH